METPEPKVSFTLRLSVRIPAGITNILRFQIIFISLSGQFLDSAFSYTTTAAFQIPSRSLFMDPPVIRRYVGCDVGSVIKETTKRKLGGWAVIAGNREGVAYPESTQECLLICRSDVAIAMKFHVECDP
jgi:hypothetical protein